ncbi:unnamed protein product [Ostreobium quekettii]|uniref:Uncharacterized protein n=1 Tax=Ostreobium quekettii TaxID=121088 RepID=A0A8S1J6R9_9CHLO|nr:unnamed protein product [Ostreobium quekettii]
MHVVAASLTAGAAGLMGKNSIRLSSDCRPCVYGTVAGLELPADLAALLVYATILTQALASGSHTGSRGTPLRNNYCKVHPTTSTTRSVACQPHAHVPAMRHGVSFELSWPLGEQMVVVGSAGPRLVTYMPLEQPSPQALLTTMFHTPSARLAQACL